MNIYWKFLPIFRVFLGAKIKCGWFHLYFSYIVITILKLRPDNHVLISAFYPFIFSCWCLRKVRKQNPTLRFLLFKKAWKKCIKFKKKDFTFEGKHYRLFIAVPPKTQKWEHGYPVLIWEWLSLYSKSKGEINRTSSWLPKTP